MPIDKLFTDADQFIFGQLQAHLLVGKIQFSQQKGFPPAALDMKNTFKCMHIGLRHSSLHYELSHDPFSSK